MSDGSALIKAVACSKPIFPSKRTAMAELADRESHDLAVDCNSAEGIREAVAKLKQNPGLSEPLGANKMTVYEQEYGWQVMEQRLLLLYFGDGQRMLGR